MRTFILPLALLALVSCNMLRNTSKVNDKYKPLKKFKLEQGAEIGSDTANYLIYNFIEHKDKYIGKPFGSLVKDLKIPIASIYFTPIYFDQTNCEKIRINFFNPYRNKTGVEYYLIVYFKDKFIYSELYNLRNNTSFEWNQSQLNYLKDKLIKNLIIADSRDWNKKN